MMNKLDLIIPCYNEQECVDLIYQHIKATLEGTLLEDKWQVIYIDDGSKDKTCARIQTLAQRYNNVKYISFARNFGKEAALYAGLKNSTADYVAVMDADLQHPPELLIKMISILENEEFDCAAARRVTRKGEPPIRSALSATFYHIINWATGMHLVPGMTDYRMMKRKVVNAIVQLQERERFIKGIYAWVGFKTKWIEYENVERVAGDSKWNIRGLWNYAKSGYIAFANTPLRSVIYLGTLVVLVSIVYAINLFWGVMTGQRAWTEDVTIIFLLMFLGGGQSLQYWG